MGRRVREVHFNWPVQGIRVIDLVSGLVSACFRIGREVMRPHFDWPAHGIRHMGPCFRLVSTCFRTAAHATDAALPLATAAILRQGVVFPGCFTTFVFRWRPITNARFLVAGESTPKHLKREEAWLPRPLYSGRGNTLPLFCICF